MRYPYSRSFPVGAWKSALENSAWWISSTRIPWVQIPIFSLRIGPSRSEEHTSELQSPDLPYTTLFRSQGPLSCQGNRPQSVRLEHGQGPKRPQCVIPIQGASPSAPGNPLWKIQHGGFLRPEFRGFRYPFSVYELDR